MRACDRAGGQAEFARQHELSREFINLVIHGKRAPSAAVLKVLGLERVVTHTYVRRKPGAP